MKKNKKRTRKENMRGRERRGQSVTKSDGLDKVFRGLRARRDTGVDARAGGGEGGSAAENIRNGEEADLYIPGFDEKRGRGYSSDEGDQDEKAVNEVYTIEDVY